MFETKTYVERRKALKKDVKSGLILFVGNTESPMNYLANTFHFRQDSSFLYFFGIDKPDFYGLIDVDADKDYLFGVDFTVDDIVWMGPQPSVRELGQMVGVENTGDPGQLVEILKKAQVGKKKIHFLPPYRGETKIILHQWLALPLDSLKQEASVDLIKAVVKQREIKSPAEVAEIEKALAVSWQMYNEILKMARPGVFEREITGKIEGLVGSAGGHIAFPVILSIHGETLHNHAHGNQLKQGNLLVADSGAESPEYYASDITRTFPVGGTFTPRQKEVYEIVLKGQMTAIEAIRPGKKYKEVHLQVARVMADGLKAIGLMKGDMVAAVENGAHALFFPHGLGHMIGLDVHDMENFGEDYIGYDHTVQRSTQFGLAYLRLAKELKPSFVLTVEPGIYFIPALIDLWKQEKKWTEFIDYDKVETYKDFGGIRIEDNVLVTADGHRVLGQPIPKKIDDIASIMMG